MSRIEGKNEEILQKKETHRHKLNEVHEAYKREIQKENERHLDDLKVTYSSHSCSFSGPTPDSAFSPSLVFFLIRPRPPHAPFSAPDLPLCQAVLGFRKLIKSARAYPITQRRFYSCIGNCRLSQ